MLTADFDYHLPEELIASRPLDRRDASRMMVVHRATGVIEHRQFAEFPQFAADSLLVLNNTRVAKARYFSNDGRIELLRLQALTEVTWRCLVKPGKKMRLGATVAIGEAVGTVQAIDDSDGSRIIEFSQPVDTAQFGHLALPHYMNREDDGADAERYQTVFADPGKEQAIAAPTAGLHFTPEMLATLPHTFVTLHVGIGTFRPVQVDRVEDHLMHVESYEVSPEAAARITSAPRVLAVGTTVTRVLEHCYRTSGTLPVGPGSTDIFITPGFQFRRADALLTNFHLPKSTLFMLVSALASRELMQAAYAAAVEHRYRFFSYGDCMLIL
jgi:S-adenosylmethionine:tRNA ribosyltransferase-isomerase